MINWTEEDIQFAVKNIVIPCLDVYTENRLRFSDMYHDSYEKLFKLLSSEIAKCKYEMAKDRHYFLAFLGQKHGYTLEQMRDTYDKYCEEYDKLNKHLLDDKDVSKNE